MKKIAILIATTHGPVLVERITPEPAPQSMVCLSRQSTILPISGDYEDFVRLGSGVIIREFPLEEDMSFRLDVSGEITTGKSWQLGFFAAHAVFQAPNLSLSSVEEADQILWLSATVDYDLNIAPVDHIDQKVEASFELLSQTLKANKKLTFLLHPENAEDVQKAAPPQNVEVIALTHAQDLLDYLHLKRQGVKSSAKGLQKRTGNAGFWAMAGVAFGAVLVLFYLREPQKEDVYLQREPQKEAPLELDIFSNQGQAARHRFGDDLDLWIKTSKKAWLYCFYEQADGGVLQIYPNGAMGAPKPFEPVIQHHLSGSEDAEFVIRLGPPAGLETITCYASVQDISLRLPTALRGLSVEPLPATMAGSVGSIFETLTDVEISVDQMQITLRP